MVVKKIPELGLLGNANGLDDVVGLGKSWDVDRLEDHVRSILLNGTLQGRHVRVAVRVVEVDDRQMLHLEDPVEPKDGGDRDAVAGGDDPPEQRVLALVVEGRAAREGRNLRISGQPAQHRRGHRHVAPAVAQEGAGQTVDAGPPPEQVDHPVDRGTLVALAVEVLHGEADVAPIGEAGHLGHYGAVSGVEVVGRQEHPEAALGHAEAGHALALSVDVVDVRVGHEVDEVADANIVGVGVSVGKDVDVAPPVQERRCTVPLIEGGKLREDRLLGAGLPGLLLLRHHQHQQHIKQC